LIILIFLFNPINVDAGENEAKLNLSLKGNENSNNINYSTNDYTTDKRVISYNSEGWYAPTASLFWLDNMISATGEIIYKFDSITFFIMLVLILKPILIP
jgi:hypothetical protein